MTAGSSIVAMRRIRLPQRGHASTSRTTARRLDYNEVRPHSALGNRTPTEYVTQLGLAQ